MMNIISIIEGDAFGSAARQRLCERHWSNILAWLLSEQFAGKEISSKMLSVLLKLSGIELRGNRRIVKVEREIRVGHKENSRIIDVLVTFEEGWKLHIENKIDSAYEDVNQLHGEIAALSENDQLIFLCPNDFSLLFPETRELLATVPNFHHVKWLDYANQIAIIKMPNAEEAALSILAKSILSYWSDREKEDYSMLTEMMEKIINIKGWSRFYQDEFKAAFCETFPEAYEELVDQRGQDGNWNAHWYLMHSLSMLAIKGFLRDTGNSRTPVDPTWRASEVYEYEVVGGTDEDEGVS